MSVPLYFLFVLIIVFAFKVIFRNRLRLFSLVGFHSVILHFSVFLILLLVFLLFLCCFFGRWRGEGVLEVLKEY